MIGMTDAEELIDALYGMNLTARSYSGRAMYGANCVGVDLESISDLWSIATDLAQQRIEVGAPSVDSMGLGIIAYWPSITWPEGRKEAEED